MTEPWRRPHVQGFIVQCSVCPQKAVVDIQPEPGWVCPLCTEVGDPPRRSVHDLHVLCAFPFGAIAIAVMGSVHWEVPYAEPVETGTPDRRTHQCEACGQWDGHRTGCLAAKGWWTRSWDSLGCDDDDYPVGGVTA